MSPTVAASADGLPHRAAEVLRSGGVVVLPTDTVYGLAAAAHRPDAVSRLFRLKGRAADVPVAVLCTDAAQALALADRVPPAAARLSARHWPGPLTLVLTRRRDLMWELGEPSGTIGVRCPDHDLVRSIAAIAGPLATTSANRHGSPTPASAGEAAASLTGPVDLVIDGGSLEGRPSTVVDCTGERPVVLRQGSIDLDDDDDAAARDGDASAG